MSGCSTTPAEVGPAREVPKSDLPDQVEEIAQADRGNETSEPTATAEPDQPGETGEPVQSGQADEPEIVATASPAGQAEQAGDTDQIAHTAVNLADVISVEASGDPGSYTFSVGIASPDTGCELYADWWEVLSEEGRLIYRRVLLHSHVSEQPFVRSGGPVEIAAGQVVWVRAHMNSGGYGGAAFKGSVATGFQPAELDPQFAAGAANLAPLPNGCNF